MSSKASSRHLEEISSKQALQELGTDSQKGLSEDEAQKRLNKYGENAIEEKKKNPVLEFLSHFWGPIPWMIEIAAILAGSVRRWEEFGVILALLLVNGGVSYWHESKANQAIEALKKEMALDARAIRDGKQKTIPARQLVPGDIIVLHIGNVIPADAKLLEKQHLSTDESALTGESLPVDKEESDSIYSGTGVKQGEARAVVTATGRNTRFAKTVELVAGAKVKSHFQRAVLRIGSFLMGSAGALVITIVLVSILLRGDPVIEVIVFALGLTLAGIPVALPAVLSVTMSIGAGRLAKWKAIVSKLPAMEEMAGLKVLCADKTGTLTKNELELQDPVLLNAKDKHALILAAALTVQRDGDIEDPIDKAILEGLDDTKELDEYKIKEFHPFDPTRKMANADIEYQGKRFTVAKGAPQAILKLVGPDEKTSKEVNSKVDDLGRNGFRALGVARKDGNGKWQYLGLLSLLDPPREDSADVVKAAKEHGIDIRMVTGDHLAIAKQVAKQLDLGQDIKVANDVFAEDSQPDEPAVVKKVTEADGFAKVTPEHKFNIIKAFQSQDTIIGMTGDGVNDAPALKQADVGIAVPGAADAARAAAALVLTASGLGVITRAVEEARRIFERMISYATYRITETIRLLLFIAISVLVFNFYPVTAIMIILLAILNDIPIITIAWDNVRTPPQPVRWDMRRVLTMAGVLGIGGVAASFILFWYIRTQMQVPQETVQTIMFLKLLVAGHMTIFLTRNTGWLWDRPFPSPLLFGALEGTQIIGTLVAVYGFLIYPIGWAWAGIIWGYAIVWMLILNCLKVLVYKLLGKILPRKAGTETEQPASS
ncbi:MAG: plasma-membrane proton-efflux P-type ATPase [Chloroflexota bacterium]